MRKINKFSIVIALIFFVLTLSGCIFRSPSIQPTMTEFDAAAQASKSTLKNTPVNPAAANPTESATAGNNGQLPPVTKAVIKTNRGDLVFKFYPASPNTVANFVKLASSGFYNGVKFHRVIKGFMVQTGDPNSKDDDWSNDGQGGPGYQFADEINNNKLVRGSLAMANAGPNTNGSQFFIVTAAATPWLDGKHTNFGELIEGQEILAEIESSPINANDHPLSDIVIQAIELK